MVATILETFSKDVQVINDKIGDRPCNALSIEKPDAYKEIENILLENGVPILTREWMSKYNNYVVYDYEPFCIEGFKLRLAIDTSTPQALFALELINKYCSAVDELNARLTGVV
ncbi:MAG: hypothetical protein NC218_08065 [Acetobacter sp.]|nr:hypothetical protein [Acetobacter sp.]